MNNCVCSCLKRYFYFAGTAPWLRHPELLIICLSCYERLLKSSARVVNHILQFKIKARGFEGQFLLEQHKMPEIFWWRSNDVKTLLTDEAAWQPRTFYFSNTLNIFRSKLIFRQLNTTILSLNRKNFPLDQTLRLRLFPTTTWRRII